MSSSCLNSRRALRVCTPFDMNCCELMNNNLKTNVEKTLNWLAFKLFSHCEASLFCSSMFFISCVIGGNVIVIAEIFIEVPWNINYVAFTLKAILFFCLGMAEKRVCVWVQESCNESLDGRKHNNIYE